MNKTKFLRIGTISALTAAMLCSVSSVPVTHADSPAVSYSYWAPEQIKAPLQKPQWTAAVDPNAAAAVTDDGTVLSFSGKKLIALNLANGKKIYTYGSTLKPTVQYLKGSAYGIGEDGHVYAVNAKTGKELWHTAASLTDVDSPVVIGDTVYVTKKNAVIALEAATGKQRWKAIEEQAENGGSITMEEDGVVFVSYILSGALSFSQVNAIDKKTGKILWKADHHETPLAVKDGLVYSKTEPTPFGEESDTLKVTLSALNAKTGKVMGERVYSWPKADVNSTSSGYSGSMLLDGNDLYLVTENSVSKYDFSHYEPEGKPLKKWSKPSSLISFIGSVHAGRVYFMDYATNAVLGMKLADGQKVNWRTDNPPIQTDIYGNGVYVGQSDGLFHGYNLQTTAPAFTVNTGSRNYGPTLRSSNMLVIQAKDAGKLIAVPVPKALQ
ncbi:PQQ-binding-like beta-propeller repeat protein [Paenibacillus dokdonensis]|uniref:PQQ-binding-like beta-propeller repeat protein n=1 Tax=Paenibacillus dokdonensis TaxID=2567944 RepID=A0ABU6GMI7_9BACL|nr:PQQ-binding-like beta-propeller repeat protein [Paenibacillus dokdonensis]MEC0240966.1 PQQ-binding-like beta-propeller repeat protein [Paenibacillus dokdonensis]